MACSAGGTQGLVLGRARSGLRSELCGRVQCSRVTFRARGQAEAIARNISPNAANTQRSKHRPWHLKKSSSLRPPSLDKQGQYHRYFYYFLAFTSQAHLPTVPWSIKQTTQPPSGLRGENYNSQNGLRPGGFPKEPMQFQASRVPLSLAFKAKQPPEVRGGDWLAAPAAQDPRGGDGACVVLGAMNHLSPGP